LAIQAAGTGAVRIGDALISFPETDGLPGQALVTDGSGDLGWDYGVPVGTIIAYAGTSAPTGYLDCDGANVSRATYSALFSAIGTTWGVGDGVTTFGVPDLRRRTMVGSGGVASAGPANTVGSTGGNETVNIAHTHSFTPAGTLDTVASGPTAAAGGAAFTVVSNGHSHTFTGSGGTTGSGGSTGLNMFQPSAVVKFAIKH
ncbi:MAG: phage tail protein, partial [Anaerolineae bacterium]|nr:phage tail protein [Anaerolineae bacterium]